MNTRARIHLAVPDAPIACTADAGRAEEQIAGWRALRSVGEARPIDGGVRLTLPLDRADEIHDLAAREAECCAFLTIGVRTDTEATIVEITSSDPDARSLITLITGVEMA